MDDPYETLGVAQGATADEVRAAYFRLVRTHTPEDAPERFQAISEAYRVLSDPKLRQEHDRALGFPPDVAAALERAAELCEKDPDRAVLEAKRVLEVARPAPVRFAVAVVCLRAGKPLAVLRILEALVREDPGSAEYAFALGNAYRLAGRSADAEKALRRAIDLDPSQRDPYEALAALLQQRGKPERAIEIVREGLAANGVPTLADLGLLLRWFCLVAVQGRADEYPRVLRALRSTIPVGDMAAEEHVSVRVGELADEFVRLRRFDLAVVLMTEVEAISKLPAIGERVARLSTAAAAQAEAERAMGDGTVAPWIRNLLPARFRPATSQEQFQRLLDGIASTMGARLAEADAEWAAFSSRFPAAAEYVRDLHEAIRKAAAESQSAAVSRRSRTAAPAPASSASQIAAIIGLVIIVFAIRSVTCAGGSSPRLSYPASENAPTIVTPESMSAWARSHLQQMETATASRLRRELGREPTPEELSAEMRRITELGRKVLEERRGNRGR